MIEKVRLMILMKSILWLNIWIMSFLCEQFWKYLFWKKQFWKCIFWGSNFEKIIFRSVFFEGEILKKILQREKKRLIIIIRRYFHLENLVFWVRLGECARNNVLTSINLLIFQLSLKIPLGRLNQQSSHAIIF